MDDLTNTKIGAYNTLKNGCTEKCAYIKVNAAVIFKYCTNK